MVGFTIYSNVLIINSKILYLKFKHDLFQQFQNLTQNHWHYLRKLIVDLRYLNFLHHLPLLHHIHFGNHIPNVRFNYLHHVFGYLFAIFFNLKDLFFNLGILIIKNLSQISNQLLIAFKLVPLILKIQTLHWVTKHDLYAQNNFKLLLHCQFDHKQVWLVDLFWMRLFLEEALALEFNVIYCSNNLNLNYVLIRLLFIIHQCLLALKVVPNFTNLV